MRVFKYWRRVEGELTIGNEKSVSSVWGGANSSVEDAWLDGNNRLEQAQKRIDCPEELVDTDYEVDILEEIVDHLDRDNVVTRNRYGALVLNSANTLFIDVDYVRPGWWDRLYHGVNNGRDKGWMLRFIKKRLPQLEGQGLQVRVYETHKGYRIAVLSKSFAPRSLESIELMRLFRGDILYGLLCLKQNCYRARLTPKPYRMRFRAYKMPYPERTPEQDRQEKAWVAEYEAKSASYAVCDLVYATEEFYTDSVIKYHDRVTGVGSGRRLV